MKSKEWKGVACKSYESVLYRTLTGNGVEFGASWVKDVDRMNLTVGKIMVYDSLMSKTNIRKATTKLASLASVLPDYRPWPIIASQKCPQQHNGGDCCIFTLEMIEFLFCGLPSDRITTANIPEYRLRMAIDMLHHLHNVQCVVHDSNLWLTINFLYICH
ncbi:sentrin-specific protease 1-like [Pyrus ussuriensis x Pyrus communis]|uniref:Sentrin-specific protease 1-like n=1 Tax=Pyrus ussuriensis x Pyrus communis TaxID=2448454 RepID=A0A5N5HSW9_9ROSA|nr:sentrin-specific protease 1-like [Pyrus ussuriensis x Pyrus communis]